LIFLSGFPSRSSESGSDSSSGWSCVPSSTSGMAVEVDACGGRRGVKRLTCLGRIPCS
jgi:hypothetical protein